MIGTSITHSALGCAKVLGPFEVLTDLPPLPSAFSAVPLFLLPSRAPQMISSPRLGFFFFSSKKDKQGSDLKHPENTSEAWNKGEAEKENQLKLVRGAVGVREGM